MKKAVLLLTLLCSSTGWVIAQTGGIGNTQAETFTRKKPPLVSLVCFTDENSARISVNINNMRDLDSFGKVTSCTRASFNNVCLVVARSSSSINH